MVRIIGGGLAGCEAAWQVASRGVPVTLSEMRPVRPTAVHKTDRLAELVCSNSFRGDKLDNAVGLLKEEMRRLGSLVMRAAEASRVPAGAALAVDRERFAQTITEAHRQPSVDHRSVVKKSRRFPASTDREPVHRGDRAADLGCAVSGHRSPRRRRPLVRSTTRSVRSSSPRPSIARRYSGNRGGIAASGRVRSGARAAAAGSREAIGPACGVDDGQGDYLNCPLTRDEYQRFYDALTHAESATVHDFDKEKFFEGLPADRSDGASRCGHAAFRPDEAGRSRRSANRPDALRGRAASTGQSGGRSLQPGRISDADQMGRPGACASADPRARTGRVRPLRHGASQYLCERARRSSRKPGSCAIIPSIFFAGQMSGVEGYVESAASGLLAGMNAAALASGAAAVRAAADDGDRRAGVLCVARQPRALRAVEHHLRHHGAAGAAAARQDGSQAGDGRSRARSACPRGCRGRRMTEY